MRTPTYRKGFATVMAVSMIALVGAMLVMLMAQLRDTRDGSRQIRIESELRQMLIVGGAAADKLVADPKESHEVKLPPSLTQRGGSVVVKTLPAQNELEMRIGVEASLDGRTARQTLRYVKTEDGWGLLEALLD